MNTEGSANTSFRAQSRNLPSQRPYRHATLRARISRSRYESQLRSVAPYEAVQFRLKHDALLLGRIGAGDDRRGGFSPALAGDNVGDPGWNVEVIAGWDRSSCPDFLSSPTRVVHFQPVIQVGKASRYRLQNSAPDVESNIGTPDSGTPEGIAFPAASIRPQVETATLRRQRVFEA